ncbi:MAG: hypothetical protein UH081_07890 [Clostridia bacterium]|nr:hypothetical protein [Clostridia bacterium]
MLKYNGVLEMIDEIVFTQAQLDKAIAQNCRNIVLCDNSFNIPPVGKKCYTALGEITATAMFGADFACGNDITFCGFTPVFEVPSFAYVPQKSVGISGSYGSYSSYGSYGSGSFSRNVSSYIFKGGSARNGENVFVSGYGINLI